MEGDIPTIQIRITAYDIALEHFRVFCGLSKGRSTPKSSWSETKDLKKTRQRLLTVFKYAMTVTF